MEDEMTESTSTPTCPMAAACKGMMNKPMSGLMLVIPALIFVIFGVAVLIAPQILAWLVGIALILMGVAMLLFGRFMRRFSERS
jgi:uncharacterized membrane protein HdeD (DUF308 family)